MLRNECWSAKSCDFSWQRSGWGVLSEVDQTNNKPASGIDSLRASWAVIEAESDWAVVAVEA